MMSRERRREKGGDDSASGESDRDESREGEHQGDLLDGAETEASAPSEESDPEVPEPAAPEPDASGSKEPGTETPEAEIPDSEEDPEPSPGSERLKRAKKRVEDGRAEEAAELYREIIRDHPGHLKARNNLGVLYDEMGAHELALEELEAAQELEPENVEILANRSSALVSLGRFDEAEELLERAQRLDPDNVHVRTNLGVLYFRRGLYDDAVEELRWVCERDPENGLAHFYRGEALNRLGRVDEALDALETATHLQPGNHRAYYTMGILFDKKHLPEQAAVMYRKSRELRPR